jgi:hypothetical protein
VSAGIATAMPAAPEARRRRNVRRTPAEQGLGLAPSRHHSAKIFQPPPFRRPGTGKNSRMKGVGPPGHRHGVVSPSPTEESRRSSRMPRRSREYFPRHAFRYYISPQPTTYISCQRRMGRSPTARFFELTKAGRVILAATGTKRWCSRTRGTAADPNAQTARKPQPVQTAC